MCKFDNVSHLSPVRTCPDLSSGCPRRQILHKTNLYVYTFFAKIMGALLHYTEDLCTTKNPTPNLQSYEAPQVSLKFFRRKVRVGAHMGPYVFFKSDTFRVQTAPFDKITIDFCRSRRRLHDSDLILTKNPNI